MFSYNGGNRLESKTTRMYGMFRRVRQVAAPWAKSAVSDFILLKGKNIRAFIKNHRNRWRHLTDLREKLRWPIRFAPPGYVEFEGSAIITKRSVLTYILVPQQIRFSIYCICLLYQSVDLRASSAPVKWGGLWLSCRHLIAESTVQFCDDCDSCALCNWVQITLLSYYWPA